MHWSTHFRAMILLLAGLPAVGWAAPDGADQRESPAVPAPESAAELLLGSIGQDELRALIAEVLQRNPGVAAAQAQARAAVQRAPQIRALPDPVASLTAFLETPETRTGPQRLMAGISQGLPWFGKLALKEQAALYAAAVLDAEVEAKRLGLVTEARRLYYELAFLNRYREITEEFRTHLLQHEEISRARYSTGVGLGQAVVKLQAEITRVENRLLDIDTRQVALRAQVNSLRDRPASVPLGSESLPETAELALDADQLHQSALRRRPELSAADTRIARAETLIRLAEKGYRPDFMVGLTYTLVDPRDDAPGRLQPPPGNGDDIFGIQGGITLPVWRRKLAAGVEEAVELQTSAAEAKRDTIAAIEASAAWNVAASAVQ